MRRAVVKLYECLIGRVLGIKDWSDSPQHRAANDAFRALAILSSLIITDHPTFNALVLKTRIRKHYTEIPKPSEKHPYAARITTLDRSRLHRDVSSL